MEIQLLQLQHNSMEVNQCYQAKTANTDYEEHPAPQSVKVAYIHITQSFQEGLRAAGRGGVGRFKGSAGRNLQKLISYNTEMNKARAQG